MPSLTEAMFYCCLTVATLLRHRVDTTASMPLTIKAGSLLLRNISYRMSMMPVIDSLSATVPLAVLA